MYFLETLFNGLSLGSTYAIIALGYTMVYGIAKMLNFAHGDIIMVGSYVIWFTFLQLNINPYISILLAILFCMLLGITIEKIAYRPLRGAPSLAVLITAIGISSLLQGIPAILSSISSSSSNPALKEKLGGILSIGSLQELSLTNNIKIGNTTIPISVNGIITLITAIAVMIALTMFIKRTRTGRAMVAVSENRDAALLMGININKIITITFAIGSALAGVAAILMVTKGQPPTSDFGALPGIIAFSAAVIGGIGSIPGAALGGLLLGLVETFCKATVLSKYTLAIEFAILIIILLLKPSGILGKQRREKV